MVYPSAERLDGEVFTPDDLIALDIVTVFWRPGQVSSSIVAKSGLDDFFEEAPIDLDDVRRVADLMDARIADLVG